MAQCRFKDICVKVMKHPTAEKCSADETWECAMADKIQDLLMDFEKTDDEAEFEEE